MKQFKGDMVLTKHENEVSKTLIVGGEINLTGKFDYEARFPD